MKLSKELGDNSEWLLVGPMGPRVAGAFSELPVLAVDGGANFTERMDVWVGDSDSFQAEPGAPVKFHLPEDKDASDLAMALRLLDRKHNYTLHLWGFSGGRKDHELFVIGEALAFLDQHPESKFVFYHPSGKIQGHFVGAGLWRFERKGLFSLGSLKRIRVKLTGDVKFPIPSESWLPPLSSWGLSNTGTGEIILETDGPAFLFYQEEE